MFAGYYPGEYVDSTYGIDFGALYAQGYRGIIFDIDNTLVPHGAPADARAKALFAKLKELGFHQKKFEGEFYGRPFRDNQLSKVYLYIEAIDITKLILQEEEVSEVIWMDYAKCKKGIQENTIRHCIYLDEFEMVGKGLGLDG